MTSQILSLPLVFFLKERAADQEKTDFRSHKRTWTVEPVDISRTEFDCFRGITTDFYPLGICTCVLTLQVCCALETIPSSSVPLNLRCDDFKSHFLRECSLLLGIAA